VSSRPVDAGRRGRLGRLNRELAELGAAALVVVAESAEDPDLAPFAGGGRLGEAFVVAPRGAAPRLGYWTPMERDEAAASGLELLTPELLDLPRLAREHPEPAAFLAAGLAAALARCGVVPGTIALAGRAPAGTLAAALDLLRSAGWSFVSGSDASRRLRKRKTAAEIADARRAAAVTASVFRALAGRLAAAVVRGGELRSEGERLTVGRLAREVAVAFADAGLAQPRPPILAPGEEGGVPHSGGSPERVLRVGESLVVDLFPRGRLFADCTRTFCVGEPPEALARAHDEVRAALTLAHAECAPGRIGWDLQKLVCERFAERGWPTPITVPGSERGYVHNLGHGVGYELHELPSFRDRAAPGDGLLEPGDLITLEPGLYEPGAGGFGVRLEDMLLVGEGGVEILTPLPYGLDPRSWRD
jgi:Xaa-Pro aminopeptidase